VQPTWLKIRLVALVLPLLGLMLSVATLQVRPVEARPGGPKDEKPKSEDPPEWSDPFVQGTVDKLYWADGKVKGTWTPTLQYFSNESNMEVTVYVDEPGAQGLVRDGSVCVGRFVVATGFRIDERTLSAQGLQILNPDAPCSSTISAPPS
jgi:hypothetical protein